MTTTTQPRGSDVLSPTQPSSPPSPSPFPTPSLGTEAVRPGLRHGEVAIATAGEADGPGRMIGDVNFFLHSCYDNDDDDDDPDGDDHIINAHANDTKGRAQYEDLLGEVDIMVAESDCRGKGIGKAAVAVLIEYVRSNIDEILAEYHGSKTVSSSSGENSTPRLRSIMAKIQHANTASIALFQSLGFVPDAKGPNYFGEIQLILHDWERCRLEMPSYTQVRYVRPNQ